MEKKPTLGSCSALKALTALEVSTGEPHSAPLTSTDISQQSINTSFPPLVEKMMLRLSDQEHGAAQ